MGQNSTVRLLPTIDIKITLDIDEVIRLVSEIDDETRETVVDFFMGALSGRMYEEVDEEERFTNRYVYLRDLGRVEGFDSDELGDVVGEIMRICNLLSIDKRGLELLREEETSAFMLNAIDELVKLYRKAELLRLDAMTEVDIRVLL